MLGFVTIRLGKSEKILSFSKNRGIATISLGKT